MFWKQVVAFQTHFNAQNGAKNNFGHFSKISASFGHQLELKIWSFRASTIDFVANYKQFTLLDSLNLVPIEKFRLHQI